MNNAALAPAAYTLLLGVFGISLVLAIRRGESVHFSFERLVLGYFAIYFHLPLLTGLATLGAELDLFLRTLGDAEGVYQFVGKALYDSSTKFDSTSAIGFGANIANYINQVLRTGVWGILSSITELFFVLAAFVLEVSRDAVGELLLVLFPVAAALFPVSHRFPLAMLLLALELALWLPLLTILNVATSAVARRYATISSDLGFYVLALEIVSICLTTLIPLIAHKLVSGALSGNIVDRWQNPLSTGASLIMSVPRFKSVPGILNSFRSLGGLRSILIPTSLLLFSFSASAKDSLILRQGFVHKLPCNGRLWASGIGDETLVALDPLPQEIGCGVLLTPLRPGETNIILETSTGTIEKTILVRPRPPKTKASNSKGK